MKVDVDNLEIAISNILKDYGDVVYQATEEGLNAAEKVLIKNLKASSPGKNEKTGAKGEYKKGWKSKGKKYKLKRYVGNTKMVHGKSGQIPLSNILEYSPKSPHQGLIKRTYERSVNEMANAIMNEIKKEV
jgi:hypothetical protein